MSDFGLPPKQSATSREKHTRADDVQLSVEEMKLVNSQIENSKYYKKYSKIIQIDAIFVKMNYIFI